MTLRIGLVGAGALASTYAQAVHGLPGASIAAVASPNTAAGFAARHGIAWHFKDYRSLLEATGVDVVAIAAPTDLHYDICLAACDAGKHIVCPPPLATTFAEAEDMLHAARRAGITFLYAEPAILNPVFARMVDLATTGLAGDVYLARCRSARPLAAAPWANDADRAGGGVLMQQGCAAILLFARAFGAWPQSVQATARSGSHPGLDGHATLALDFGESRMGIAECSAVAPAPVLRFEIEGDGGLLAGDQITGRLQATYRERQPGSGAHSNAESEEHWPYDGARDSGAAQLWQHVIDVLAGRSRPTASIEDGIAVLEVVYAAYAAASEGRVMALPFACGDEPPGSALSNPALGAVAAPLTDSAP